MLALTGKARLWEPRRLRLRLFAAAGQLVRHPPEATLGLPALPTISPARENGPPTPSGDRHETSRPDLARPSGRSGAASRGPFSGCSSAPRLSTAPPAPTSSARSSGPASPHLVAPCGPATADVPLPVHPDHGLAVPITPSPSARSRAPSTTPLPRHIPNESGVQR
jgi:hypothetical protein